MTGAYLSGIPFVVNEKLRKPEPVTSPISLVEVDALDLLDSTQYDFDLEEKFLASIPQVSEEPGSSYADVDWTEQAEFGPSAASLHPLRGQLDSVLPATLTTPLDSHPTPQSYPAQTDLSDPSGASSSGVQPNGFAYPFTGNAAARVRLPPIDPRPAQSAAQREIDATNALGPLAAVEPSNKPPPPGSSLTPISQQQQIPYAGQQQTQPTPAPPFFGGGGPAVSSSDLKLLTPTPAPRLSKNPPESCSSSAAAGAASNKANSFDILAAFDTEPDAFDIVELRSVDDRKELTSVLAASFNQPPMPAVGAPTASGIAGGTVCTTQANGTG